MLPEPSRFGIDGSIEGEKAGLPWPAPKRLRLGPAAAAVAYELLLSRPGGSIDPAGSRSSIASEVAIIVPPIRGGKMGGSEDDAVSVACSFGAGLLDFERSAVVPLARRNQDGLDFTGGFEAGSMDDDRELMTGD